MTDHKWNSELQKQSHVALIVTITVFSLVLIVLNRLLGWEIWMMPVIIGGCAASIFMHIEKLGSERNRTFIYAANLLFELFYYAVNVDTVYDTSPVVLMVMIVFTATREKLLIYLGMAVGYFGMIFHLLMSVNGENGLTLELSNVTRTVWHFVIILIVTLMTDRIMAGWSVRERESMEKLKTVEAENRRINNFLMNVSHEIRTPINAVVGLSTVMLRREKDESIAREIASVKEAGRRVAEQVGDILDFTELDMGRLAVTNEAYAIASLVNDLITENETQNPTACELIFDVDASMPTVLIGDGLKIKKILNHLIANGVKFSENGGVYIRVYANKRPYGVNLCIEVSDTGIGMTEEELEHIYESFYQSSEGRTRTAGGLGLGLTIVRGMVREMNGFLTIESERGGGTTVSVSIPQQVADPTSCMSIEDAGQVAAVVFARMEKYDKPQIRDFYSRILSNLAAGLGVTVHVAKSEEELRRLRETGAVTHVLAGEEEYRSAQDYLEPLARELHIAVSAGRDFRLPPNSAVKLLRKPTSSLSVAALLGSMTAREGVSSDNRQIYTPGIEALVVDDEPMNLLVANEIFGGYGMRVTSARSGPEAIELCAERHFDIIFMDHMMPEMDGVEAMKKIRAGSGVTGKEVPIVALTANAVSSAREMFRAEGFDGFVAKPIEITVLEHVLKQVLPKSAIRYDYTPVEPAAEPGQAEAGSSPAERGLDREALERAGVQTQTGLRYCRDDESFYCSLLREYGKTAEQKTRELRAAYEAENWEDYAIRVHALKSTSKMIGASELSETARRLEAAAKAGDGGAVAREHEAMLGVYADVSDAIRRALGEAEKAPAAEAAGGTEDGVMEFYPAEDEIMEFAPEEE